MGLEVLNSRFQHVLCINKGWGREMRECGPGSFVQLKKETCKSYNDEAET